MEKPLHAFQGRGANPTMQDAADRLKRPIMLTAAALN
jgi:hypothetical protein